MRRGRVWGAGAGGAEAVVTADRFAARAGRRRRNGAAVARDIARRVSRMAGGSGGLGSGVGSGGSALDGRFGRASSGPKPDHGAAASQPAEADRADGAARADGADAANGAVEVAGAAGAAGRRLLGRPGRRTQASDEPEHAADRRGSGAGPAAQNRAVSVIALGRPVQAGVPHPRKPPDDDYPTD